MEQNEVDTEMQAPLMKDVLAGKVLLVVWRLLLGLLTCCY